MSPALMGNNDRKLIFEDLRNLSSRRQSDFDKIIGKAVSNGANPIELNDTVAQARNTTNKFKETSSKGQKNCNLANIVIIALAIISIALIALAITALLVWTSLPLAIGLGAGALITGAVSIALLVKKCKESYENQDSINNSRN